MKFNNLKNFGFIEDRLPKKLFNLLKEECKTGEKNNPEMISGLTDKNVVKHRHLVKNKEVKQQSVISGAVHFGFNPMYFGNKTPILPHQGPVYKNYQQWCKDAEADSYGYNYWEPKYNLGRAPIGSLLNETYESLIDKFTESPFTAGSECVTNKFIVAGSCISIGLSIYIDRVTSWFGFNNNSFSLSWSLDNSICS